MHSAQSPCRPWPRQAREGISVIESSVEEPMIANKTKEAPPQRGTLKLPSYVLITPARNEAQFIGITIDSVIAQTELPLKWIIVSDGSTDGTDDVVNAYASRNHWIELLRIPERTERHFAGKAIAISAGLERMKELSYEVIVCLDADVTFAPGYISFLLGKLAFDRSLGLVGTPYRDITSETYDLHFVGEEHVSGACQVFRRACFEAIGGYRLVRGGAIDTIASTMARMKGWKTRSFPEEICFHHRLMGTAESGQMRARFNLGKRDYAIGNHPLWEVFRCAYQMTKKPFMVRALALWAGYMWGLLRYPERPVQEELVAFRRSEQMQRLKAKFAGLVPTVGVRRSQ